MYQTNSASAIVKGFENDEVAEKTERFFSPRFNLGFITEGQAVCIKNAFITLTHDAVPLTCPANIKAVGKKKKKQLRPNLDTRALHVIKIIRASERVLRSQNVK